MSVIEDNVLLNYMNQENVQLENLWGIYPRSNLDIYESVFSGMYSLTLSDLCNTLFNFLSGKNPLF